MPALKGYVRGATDIDSHALRVCAPARDWSPIGECQGGGACQRQRPGADVELGLKQRGLVRHDEEGAAGRCVRAGEAADFGLAAGFARVYDVEALHLRRRCRDRQECEEAGGKYSGS